MEEYKIDFRPTFHDDVSLELQIDDDYGIISIAIFPKPQSQKIFLSKEITSTLVQSFKNDMNKTDPLFIQPVNQGGIDGITIDCHFINDEGLTNQFSIWSPRKNEHQSHLIFINSIYDLACRLFTDDEPTRALENLRRYFG